MSLIIQERIYSSRWDCFYTNVNTLAKWPASQSFPLRFGACWCNACWGWIWQMFPQLCVVAAALGWGAPAYGLPADQGILSVDLGDGAKGNVMVVLGEGGKAMWGAHDCWWRLSLTQWILSAGHKDGARRNIMIALSVGGQVCSWHLWGLIKP